MSSPSSNASEPILPVIATLILLNGGSSTIKKVPGRKARYDFKLVQRAGPNGRAAHVREYTSLEVFHVEQADISQSHVRMQVLVRLHEIDPVQGAKSAVAALIRHLMAPQAKSVVAMELRNALQLEIERLKEVSAPDEPSGSTCADDAEAPGDQPGPRTEREIRGMELRRCGEEFVRHLLREEYQIEDVPVLNNLDGMVEAILNFEGERGYFGASEPAQPAPAAVNQSAAPQPVSAGVGSGGAAGTDSFTAESLGTMPIDELKALSIKLGCRTGNRRTMVRDILDRQPK